MKTRGQTYGRMDHARSEKGVHALLHSLCDIAAFRSDTSVSGMAYSSLRVIFSFPFIH